MRRLMLAAVFVLAGCYGTILDDDDDTLPVLPDDDDTTADDDDVTPDDDDATPDDDDTTPPDDDDVTPWDHPDPVISCSASGASMSFSPDDPDTGESVAVSVTAVVGYVYIGMAVSGGAWTQTSDLSISGGGPFTWSYGYSLDDEGWYTFTFTVDDGATPVCTGQLYAVGTGPGDDDDATPPGDDDDDDSDPGPPDNPFGIGLVGPGNTSQWDLTEELAGEGGHIKLIFAGVTPSTTGPQSDWVAAVQGVYDRDLVPVIRVGPPWGQTNIRGWSDDPGHMDYTTLAAAYAAVVAGLPMRAGWPLWIEVHNEPNLCYEWECDAAEGWMDSSVRASEYAAFLSDVTAAVQALGDPRIGVINGGLAPGGAVSCECGGTGFTAGETSLDFIAVMEAAVPGVFAALDGFTTHSYPASGGGWGFFDTYANSGVGLWWWQQELTAAGLGSGVPVFVTETGWTVGAGAYGSRQDVADWTVQAWQNDWFPTSQLEAVMPFMLQDGAWNDFAWVELSGAHYPVFDAVRDYRCSMAFPDPC